jgi:hypothetical protein
MPLTPEQEELMRKHLAPQPVQQFADGGFVQSLTDMAKQGGHAALSALGLPQMMNAIMPSPPPAADPMAKPMAQEDYQSASYKPPFGNEVTPVEPTAMPQKNTAVNTGKKPDPTNPKVESSHPGFNQDDLEKYLLKEKEGMDKYGAENQQAAYDAEKAKGHDWRTGIGDGVNDFADAVMMASGNGNPGWGKQGRDERAHELDNQMAMGKNLNDANMASIKAKEGLDTQSSANPLGASAAASMLPVLKKLYPGKTDAEYATMANNPAVAQALLPEGVKLRVSQDTITAAKENHAAARELAREKMDVSERDKEMTRTQKDQGGLQSDDEYKKGILTLAKLQPASELLKAGSFTGKNAVAKGALQTALTFVATGGQRVNEMEMKPFGGADTVVNKAKQALNRLQNGGQITDQDYKDFGQIIKIYRNAAEDSIKNAQGRHAQFRAAREGTSMDEATKALGGSLVPQSTQSDTVNVISPNGVGGTIPRANLEKAMARGYKVAQ